MRNHLLPYEVHDVKLGDKMYLAPEQRVIVWQEARMAARVAATEETMSPQALALIGSRAAAQVRKP